MGLALWVWAVGEVRCVSEFWACLAWAVVGFSFLAMCPLAVSGRPRSRDSGVRLFFVCGGGLRMTPSGCWVLDWIACLLGNAGRAWVRVPWEAACLVLASPLALRGRVIQPAISPGTSTLTAQHNHIATASPTEGITILFRFLITGLPATPTRAPPWCPRPAPAPSSCTRSCSRGTAQ